MPRRGAKKEPPTETEVVAVVEEPKTEQNGTAITPYEPGLNINAGTFALALMDDNEFANQVALMKRGRERTALIQRELMDEDIDYGKIPGTPKPTLFKPGAEKLALAYGLAARVEVQANPGDGHDGPPIQYRAQCFLHLRSFDGPVVAVGHGTCNSWEKRYRRGGSRVCPSCGQATIMKSKFNPGWYCNSKSGGCGANFRKDDPAIEAPQNANPKGEPVDQYDLDVTILKMAEKRAFVDGVLRATASSGLFTQDVAEEPADEQDYREEKAASEGAQATAITQGGRVVDASTGEIVEPETVSMTGNPDEDHAAADEVPVEVAAGTQDIAAEEAVPEIRENHVEGVGRGGRTTGGSTVQVARIKALSKALKLGPYGLVGVAQRLELAPPVLPDTTEGAKVPQEVVDTVTEWLNRLPAEHAGKLLYELQSMEEAQR